MTKNIALITGVSGQDGSYLAEILLEKKYQVVGLIRRSSLIEKKRIDHLRGNEMFKLEYGDMTDSSSISSILSKYKPTEIYNLAAQSHVQVSFTTPEYTAESDGIGLLRLLESVRSLEIKTKIYQASTSELYGDVTDGLAQNEDTPFNPVSPYAAAKLYAFNIAKIYRDAYSMHISNGILFNHESPRRGENFVSRKISVGVAKIYHGIEKKISLGNLNSMRDWGHARDYCDAMWRIMQLDSPVDLVISSGKTSSVREFVELAFKEINIEISWEGSGLDEKGIDVSSGAILVDVKKEYFRPLEVGYLLGDSARAKKILAWSPRTSLDELVKEMVQADIELLK